MIKKTIFHFTVFFYVTAAFGEHNEEFLANLAHAFAPELRFHPREQFFLGNVEDFIESTSLIAHDDKGMRELIPAGSINLVEERPNFLLAQYLLRDKIFTPVASFHESQRELNKLWLKIPEQNYENIAKAKDMDPVCYAFPKQLDDGSGIEITYFFFYPFNGPVKSSIPFGDDVLDGLSAGSHEGDFEHITVRLSNDGEKIHGAYYATHGTKESTWHYHEGKSIHDEHGYKRTADGHLLAWIALNTHGAHNRPATIRRNMDCSLGCVVKAFGLLVDKTKDGGKVIRCHEHLQLLNSHTPLESAPWLRFRGRFGYFSEGSFTSDGPHSPYFSEWFLKEPGFSKRI